MLELCLLLVSLLKVDGVLSYSFHLAKVGHNVTLPCVHASSQNANYLSWYRQATGEQPQLISSFYKSSGDNTFYNKFKNNPRFSVGTNQGCYDLSISNIQQTDSSIYYCGKTHVSKMEFDNGTVLLLNESIGVSVQQQNVSDSVVVGDSVTLNCTVHNVTSHKPHEVYWIKQDPSGPLGVLYVHTSNRPGRCVLSTGSEQSCTYSLKKNLIYSDAGTYYCAVASCGEIVFGKGTKVGRGETEDHTFLILMPSAMAVLSASVLLNIILICTVCNIWRKSSNVCEDSNIPTGYTVDSQNCQGDVLPYVALDFKRIQSNRRRHKSTEEEVVYSAVKVSN